MFIKKFYESWFLFTLSTKTRQARKPDDPIYTVESTDNMASRTTEYDDKSDSSFDEEPPSYSEKVIENDLNGLQRRMSENAVVSF